MKTTFIATILLAAVSIATSAQVNEQVDSLFATLSRIGIQVTRQQISTAFADRFTYRAILRDSTANGTICTALDRIARTAKMSYHHESHNAGNDTIKYSLCLSDIDKTVTMRTYDGIMSFYGSNAEYITFIYMRDASTDANRTDLFYTKTTKREQPDTLALFNSDAYLADVRNALKHKSVKQKAIHWRHGENEQERLSEAGLNDDYIHTERVAYVNGTYTDAGETRGMIFTIPISEKAIAADMLSRVKAIAQRYAANSPAPLLVCFPFAVFLEDLPEGLLPFYRFDTVLSATKDQPSQHISDSNCTFRVFTACDSDSYHILMLNTDGAMWIPREYATLKSYVDGKKKYY